MIYLMKILGIQGILGIQWLFKENIIRYTLLSNWYIILLYTLSFT